MRRSLPVLAAVLCAGLAVVGCGSSNNEGARVVATTAPTETATAQSGCASQQQAGIAAVFGQRRTPQAAQRVAERALASGFEGLVVERRGCNDYAVVLPGLRDLNQGGGVWPSPNRGGSTTAQGQGRALRV